VAVSFTTAEGTIIGPLDLYQQFHAELRRFFTVNARNPNSVDDLMQELFLALLTGNPSEEPRDPEAYLFAVAWNVVNAANRRESREPRDMIPIDAPGVKDVEVKDNSSSALTEARWEAVFAQLPLRCQIVVLLHFFEGRTYPEVAARVGYSVGCVKKDASKALEIFDREFGNADPILVRLPRGPSRGDKS
jgi:RNA polymerase sigma factor (sigma-70 family)